MFDDVLIESSREHDKRGPKKSLSLPVSIAVHAIVLGAIAGASIWFVEDVPEPPIPVTFYAAAPPPPPPPPPAAPKPPSAPKVEIKPVPVRPTEMTAPTIIPETVPVPLAEPEPEVVGEGDEGVEGGVPGGVPGGVLGGVPGGTGPGVGDAPLRVGGEVKAPQLINKVEPGYPEAARKARMEGVVILEAIITASGSVEEVKVLKSVNPLLDASAQRAVSQWRYRPATLNGRAVRVYLTVTVTFNLY